MAIDSEEKLSTEEETDNRIRLTWKHRSFSPIFLPPCPEAQTRHQLESARISSLFIVVHGPETDSNFYIIITQLLSMPVPQSSSGFKVGVPLIRESVRQGSQG